MRRRKPEPERFPTQPVSLLDMLLEVAATGHPALRPMYLPDGFDPMLDEMQVSFDCDAIDGIEGRVRLTIRFAPRLAQLDVSLETR